MKVFRVWLLGFREGLGDMGLTFDDDPSSRLSVAYDRGRSLRRFLWRRH
jgi:hypothetical protein